MTGTMREKRPGVWEVRVSLGPDPLHPGRYGQKSKTVHGSKRDAQKALAQLAVEANSGKHARSSATFGALLDRWLNFVGPRRSPTTMREYRRLAEQRIKPAFGARPFAKVTAADLDDWYRELEAELAPASVRQVHAVIRGTFVQAVKWRITDYNPAANASPPTVRQKRAEAPSPDVWRSLVAACPDPELVVLLRLAAATGARRGELCALRRSDLADGAVVVERAVIDVGGWSVKDTKTHAGRVVSLDSATVAALAEHVALVDKRAADAGVDLADDPFLFSREVDGSKPLRPDFVTASFSRLCKRAGVEGVHFHGLRHLHATYLLDAGVPLKTVSDRLGHAKASTTSDIYSHGVDGRDRAAADLMGGLLDGPSLGGHD